MSRLQAYLTFDGSCAEAMRAYAKVLGGKLELMTHADAPPGGDECAGDPSKVMHARLDLGDGDMLLASDWMAPSPYPGMGGFSLSLTYEAKAEAQAVFDALAEGGQVTMPLGKTFWSDAFGMLVDRFGTPWMIGVEH